MSWHREFHSLNHGAATRAIECDPYLPISIKGLICDALQIFPQKDRVVHVKTSGHLTDNDKENWDSITIEIKQLVMSKS